MSSFARQVESLKNAKVGRTNIIDIIKQGKVFLSLSISFFQTTRKRLGDKFGVRPGSEFIEAISVAEENDTKIALIDRDIQVTLRGLEQHGYQGKMKLMFSLFLGFFEGAEDFYSAFANLFSELRRIRLRTSCNHRRPPQITKKQMKLRQYLSQKL